MTVTFFLAPILDLLRVFTSHRVHRVFRGFKKTYYRLFLRDLCERLPSTRPVQALVVVQRAEMAPRKLEDTKKGLTRSSSSFRTFVFS